MPKNSDHFYNNLLANHVPLSDLLIDEKLFGKVPADWHVIITDIRGSTQAVASGLHETVNLVATGSIVTVLNLAFKAGITVPFFFGGDGATFLVPFSIVNVAMKSLLLYKTNTLTNLNLDLRVGTVPVKEIYAAGYELNISKFNISKAFTIPVVLGNGLNYAEKLIKGEDWLFKSDKISEEEELDLSGMQCRWDKISPPENTNEVVTLLVIAAKNTLQSDVFRKVILHIDEIYGTPENRQPISVSKLKLKTTFTRLSMEMRTRIGKIKLLEFIHTWILNLYGYIYFKTEKGISYLNRLVEMSDTLVIDGRINTVISGTEEQRLRLVSALNNLEKSGEIVYGIHVSTESVMSCYVRDLDYGHIHFVDGSEGGYTKAAGILKSKMK